jgi:hypothetical protein
LRGKDELSIFVEGAEPRCLLVERLLERLRSARTCHGRKLQLGECLWCSIRAQISLVRKKATKERNRGKGKLAADEGGI